MKIAYADTFSGISGDMFLGALIDAGLPENVLTEQLNSLSLDGYTFSTNRTKQNGLSAIKIDISISDDHPHRSWKSIRKLISESALLLEVKDKSLSIFSELAKAEAKVHGCPVDDVHFHEVGAVDSIIDIVGAAIGMHYFGIDRLISSPLPLSRGWVECAHGKLPLPAPAVCELVKDMEIYGVNLEQELVTPTGAAIIKALAHSFAPFPPMSVARVGYGSGSHALGDGRPNLFRLIIGSAAAVKEEQQVIVTETHLDDYNPEGFPHLTSLLFDSGALDVALIPMQMKKGRPGFLLRVVSNEATAWELQRLILTESSAIGLRYHREQRWTLPRETGHLATRWGKVAVKRVTNPDGEKILYPEYEDCRRIAKESGVPLMQIYAAVNGARANDFQPPGTD